MPDPRTSETRRAGRGLARRHASVTTPFDGRGVRSRVLALGQQFRELYRRIRAGRPGEVVPAEHEEWLVDNDHVVADTLDHLSEVLTPRFCRRLPRVETAGRQGPLLRVAALAHEWVEESEGRLDVGELEEFVQGYQEIHVLTIAELWALPAFVRLALLEWLAHAVGAIVPAGTRDAPARDDASRTGAGIVSLRRLAAEDWRRVVERLSRVEALLRDDPAGIHARMDFRTRDRYRHVVERVARQLGILETNVARAALGLAASASPHPRKGHVGYYLVDEGVEHLYRSLGARPPLLGVPSRRRRVAGIAYATAIVLLTLLAMAGLRAALPSGPAIVLLAVALVPAIGVAVSLANWLAAHLVPARTLPRLDLRKGIPRAFRTVVAVPALPASRDDVAGFLDTLEVNYQANPDPALTFALLGDFPDADAQTTPADAALLEAAIRGIALLNRRYGRGGRGPFVLLHRGRRWNRREERWMGWERKRGKLDQLNALLLGRPSELWVAEGEARRLEGAPFVLTLDADTILPRGAAARLVGTLAHPLNRPEVGRGGRVERGYSVLQPRLEVLPEGDRDTLFQRIFGSVQGLDLYAHAAFDVYQDLFDEGIFAGKGIYDVAVFQRSLEGRVPENALLSHDLFEGVHGRAGLVSDVILLEDFPGHPLTHARRAHRWIRGDWQLLPWLLPQVPIEGGRRIPNRLPALARWKIVDNLRRSLQPVALLLFLIGGWVLAPDTGWLWSLLVAAVVGQPVLIAILTALLRAVGQRPRLGDLPKEALVIARAMARWVMELAFLPFEAVYSLDAIVRTLHRLTVSRRRLLEWTSAAVTARMVRRRGGLLSLVRAMPSGPILAVLSLGAIAVGAGPPASVILPFTLLWGASPLLAWWVSLDRIHQREPSGTFPRAEARLLARRTWGYFERFQGPDGHWLPPDHFQEEPNGEVAYRTSPTNIGMGMVSAAVAWDLGFLDHSRFVTRIRNTVDGMAALTRYRGHFLNWYDTRTCTPLEPRYVSTVDSGNLAVALLTTREALREARVALPRPSLRCEGILDTIRVLHDVLIESRLEGGIKDELRREVEELVRWMDERLPPVRAADREEPGGRAACERGVRLLSELRDVRIPGLEARLLAVTEGARMPGGGLADAGAWLQHLRMDVEQGRDELLLFWPVLRARAKGMDLPAELIAALEADDERAPTLETLPTRLRAVEARVSDALGPDVPPALREALGESRATAALLLEDLNRLDQELDRWFREMEFGFLYDRRRRLFRIGFSVSAGEPDRNHYDLLASEARIASIVAIAKGEVPISHWLHLGRAYTRGLGRRPVLVSWAGTMFEYLMPTLFIRTPAGSLLRDAVESAVQAHRGYGRKRGTPWGISESAYHVLDHQGHYQYRAFGVPQLGLRRDAGDRHVVAPYASLLALQWAPGPVRRNVRRLGALGAIGPWGPYESVDFGTGAGGDRRARVVRAYMSHHHGMILASIGNYLCGSLLVERVHRDARIVTVEPFLHERLPWRRRVERRWVGRDRVDGADGVRVAFAAWSPTPGRLPPPVHVLSNGRLSVFLGSDGEGGSRREGWNLVHMGIGVGRSAGGPRLALMDLADDRSWSPLPEPDLPEDADQRVTFRPDRVEYFRRAHGIRARVAVTVAPRHDVEIRRIHLFNDGDRPRRLRLAVSADVALVPADAELGHPAFQKLFVRGGTLPDQQGVLFVRRTRRPDEPAPALAVALRVPADLQHAVAWTIDRARFCGRWGRPDRPQALVDPPHPGPIPMHHPLDPVAGAVVDLELEPYAERDLTLLLASGGDESEALTALRAMFPPHQQEWALLQARSRAEGELLELGASSQELPLWEELLAHVLHPRGRMRGVVPLATAMDLRISSLWRWGVSGDVPFVLLEVDEGEPAPLLESLVRAQAFWDHRGVRVDLVVVDGTAGGYEGPVRERVRVLLGSLHREDRVGRVGGVHLLPAYELHAEDRERLRILSAVRLRASRGGLAVNLARLRSIGGSVPDFIPPLAAASRGREPVAATDAEAAASGLEAASPYGGFDPKSGEYVIRLGEGVLTPAPWANVVAGMAGGFLVTEAGSGFTWNGDAGEFRLTPWRNDPVADLPGEVLYLRDDETGEVWTPTPLPLGLTRRHEVRHGWGTTRLETERDGLREEIDWGLVHDGRVKVVSLRLVNTGRDLRRITATYFAEWVLGPHPARTAPRILTDLDERLQAVLARNPFSLEFSDRVAFLASDGPLAGAAMDLEEFLGAGRRLDRVPAGLRRIQPGEPSRPEGAGCGVVQRSLLLEPGEAGHVRFYLGAGEGLGEARALLEGARTIHAPAAPATRAPLAAASRVPATSASSGSVTTATDAPVVTADPVVPADAWRAWLGRLRIRTPEPALDQMMNGWLTYQTVSSRIRGRTGLYQSGGAFGFRDQLQDVCSLLPLDPALAAAHLEAAAARQFRHGDVLHWWHPGTTRGVRTRCSDDLLWLPYALADAVLWTGDVALLDRRAPFLDAEPLGPDEDERYEAFAVANEDATLFDHGLRAIELAWERRGARGLPLMGTGDWNDGMDRVGAEGRGESVWLAWFLIRVLADWKSLANMRGDVELEARMQNRIELLREAVERHGWDGEWYRRAFFDDGTPLGTRNAPEAMIDSIAQSWSVISGAADPARSHSGMEAAWRHLVRTQDGLALLLTPPFEGDGLDPGYIAAYPPGVRENGGQYTHAAAWLLRAFARLGDAERTHTLLRMLLPPNRSRTAEDARRYRVEPYVVAADVYGAEPHVGRGGWTWYTGSAGWIYRVTVEDVLGLRRRGDRLEIEPCLPPEWSGYEAEWHVGGTCVVIEVANPEGTGRGVESCTVDGRAVPPDRIPLPGAGTIRVRVVLGR